MQSVGNVGTVGNQCRHSRHEPFQSPSSWDASSPPPERSSSVDTEPMHLSLTQRLLALPRHGDAGPRCKPRLFFLCARDAPALAIACRELGCVDFFPMQTRVVRLTFGELPGSAWPDAAPAAQHQAQQLLFGSCMSEAAEAAEAPAPLPASAAVCVEEVRMHGLERALAALLRRRRAAEEAERIAGGGGGCRAVAAEELQQLQHLVQLVGGGDRWDSLHAQLKATVSIQPDHGVCVRPAPLLPTEPGRSGMPYQCPAIPHP
eukprot:365143-Chlamydomonas_euryale.AAC.9